MEKLITEFFQWEDGHDAFFRLGMLFVASLSLIMVSLVILDVLFF